MTKTTKIIIWIVVIALVIWGLSSLDDGEKAPVSGEPIKIGVIAPLTGVVADYGEEIRKGVLASGVSSSSVEFVFEDDQCDPKEAVSAFKKLTEFDQVRFIIGPACGSPQEAIIPLLKGQSIIAVVPAAASVKLYADSGNNFYNIQYSLENESKFIAEKMFKRGYKKVALVSYANAFSKTHADSFRQNFKGEIAFDEVINGESSDVTTVVTKLKAAGVEAIYSPDVSFFFANGVIKLNQQKVVAPIFATYVAELPAVRTLVPNVFYSFPSDLGGAEGAVYNLSKQAALILGGAVESCRGDYDCVKRELDSTGKFDSNGIYQRRIILKQIVNGIPLTL